MRVVTGNKYPNNRWIVVDDNDNVIFDPVYGLDSRMSKAYGAKSLKLCNVYVNTPEHRDELQKQYGAAIYEEPDMEEAGKTK
jgi:hypothetical protein